MPINFYFIFSLVLVAADAKSYFIEMWGTHEMKNDREKAKRWKFISISFNKV